MLLLGIDLGTSSIKVSVVDPSSGKTLASAQFPDSETPIFSPHPGWAEQSPDTWWDHTQQAILKVNASGSFDPSDIGAIGIAYQMHGLVMTDKSGQSIRNSIIWCDSRAVDLGDEAFQSIGEKKCLSRLLNSPGNFTASKLAWVKKNEPQIYDQAAHVMLPGDFIAMKLTGNLTTSISALSEGIFWDFKKEQLSKTVINYYDLDKSLIPPIQPVFSEHGTLSASIAMKLGLTKNIPVSYKAGDQPNNALSLNVLEPGEVAATAGTSGVIYGVTDELFSDHLSRVNTFAHVNHSDTERRLGVLLCINGTGIMNSWMKKNFAGNKDYDIINKEAEAIQPGSEGLIVLPFGNGAERMFENKIIGAHFHNLNLNLHTSAHIYRAVQEGIAFAFRYGLDIMRENGMDPRVIRAGKANLFNSPVFRESFVNSTNTPLELFACDGSVGAAIGAGLGAGQFASSKEAFMRMQRLELTEPSHHKKYDALYQNWLQSLEKHLY